MVNPWSEESLPELLKRVSRSFYLTLRVLPAAIRPQIGLAYLLARASDTIADSGKAPVAQRLEHLGAVRDRILGSRLDPVNLEPLWRDQPIPAEAELLRRFEELCRALEKFAPRDQELVREVLRIIISGQALDLERFGGVAAGRLAALQTEEELDDYTYRVAGCVGLFWTKICRAHLLPQANVDLAGLFEDGLRFGKGLQLVNILRDLPADLRKGRCYLPENRLVEVGLKPLELLNPANERLFRPLFESYLDRARGHLLAGWRYTNLWPYRFFRLRLACAWPILIGLETLAKLRAASILNSPNPVKITRQEIGRVIRRSVLACPVPVFWKRLVPQELPPSR